MNNSLDPQNDMHQLATIQLEEIYQQDLVDSMPNVNYPATTSPTTS